MERNKQTIWWSTFENVPIIEDGFDTGEVERKWSEPKRLRVNVSAPYGRVEDSPFGTDVSFNCIIRAMSVPFKVGDRVWVSKFTPYKIADGEYDSTGAYKVVKIAHSLNSVAVALFSVSGD